jgi:hypothetical protein
MSKGSRPRPYSVSQQEFGDSFDRIFCKPDPKIIEDQLNEDEAFARIAKHEYAAHNERLVSNMDKNN